MFQRPDFPSPRIEPVASSDHGPMGESVAVTGGSVSSLIDQPAFAYVAPQAMPLPVLIAVPHGGRAYCPDAVARMRAPNISRLRLEDRLIDRIGSAIARRTKAALLTAHAPRAMLDLNRAESDIDWDMIESPRHARPPVVAAQAAANHRARSGLGLIPRRLPGHGEVWRSRLPRRELDRRIAHIHQPYHRLLGAELQRIRDLWGAVLLIDLHSMPPLPPREGEGGAPVVVLGDRFGVSCHHSLVTRGLDYLAREGIAAVLNRPYSGGYVLDRHGAPDAGVHAMQIELCRTLYLDADMAELSDSADALANLMAGLVQELGDHTAQLGRARGMLDAAE